MTASPGRRQRLICCGTGNDWLDGHAGFDFLYGESGDDVLNGGAEDAFFTAAEQTGLSAGVARYALRKYWRGPPQWRRWQRLRLM